LQGNFSESTKQIILSNFKNIHKQSIEVTRIKFNGTSIQNHAFEHLKDETNILANNKSLDDVYLYALLLKEQCINHSIIYNIPEASVILFSAARLNENIIKPINEFKGNLKIKEFENKVHVQSDLCISKDTNKIILKVATGQDYSAKTVGQAYTLIDNIIS